MQTSLLISGSPRKGNTEFILRSISEQFIGNKELLLLREKNIKRCCGCLSCEKSKKCVQQDDIQQVFEKMKQADVLVLGSPNYFYNVSGLMKDLIDRTNSLYKTNVFKGKKVFLVAVSGGQVKNSQGVIEAFSSFAKIHGLKIIGSHCFQFFYANDAEKNLRIAKSIKEIAGKLNSL
ncbi:MAG: flavodoxin family protein [Candidatus Pacebacteria bacterium]|nr:flavodoxin family protein [Candidatus Paceibacterota bacterium]